MKTNRKCNLTLLLNKELKPKVSTIDSEAFYFKRIIKILGEKNYFSSKNISSKELIQNEIEVIKQVSSLCMTTGFIVWCHLAATTFIRNSSNEYLQTKFLHKLEKGQIVAGTGLSNAMKYYAGLENLYLKAEQVDNGYVISGTLVSVSNLDKGHWFGALAQVNENKRILFFVSCDTKGLSLKEKKEYLGINGSGTYLCRFNQVFISDELVISEDADAFVKLIRPLFLTYQIPLGLGVTEAALISIKKSSERIKSNEYLPVELNQINKKLNLLQSKFTTLINSSGTLKWEDVITLRKEIAYLTHETAHNAMLHGGGISFLQRSADSRRLREAYFLLNLTPTLKHLEIIAQSFNSIHPT